MPPQEQSPTDKRAASRALSRLVTFKLLGELLFLMAWMMLTERLWSQHVSRLSRMGQGMSQLASLAAAGAAYAVLFGPLAVRRGALIARLTGRAPKAEIVRELETTASRPLWAACGIVLAVSLCGPVWMMPLAVLAGLAVCGWFHFRARKWMRDSDSAAPRDDYVRDRVQRLKQSAEQMGVGSIPIKVLDPFPWPVILAGCARVKKQEDWVFLSRTLLTLLDDRETVTILAHEVAHSRLGHTRSQRIELAVIHGIQIAVLAGLILGSPGTILAAWSFLPGPPRLFLALSLVGLLIHPVTAAIDRRTERAANRLALELTTDPAAFISALTKLAQHLGADRPLRWWERMISTAPALEEMTRQARQFARERGIVLSDAPQEDSTEP